MPYSGASDKDLPDYVKAYDIKKRKQWIAIFNSTFEDCDSGDCEAKAFKAANAAVKEQKVSELTEAKTKKVGGKSHPAGDFLVVEDPEKPTTWHLPVKTNGKPDRKLAAGAWAALFSPGGFRGKKYAGPGIADAKRKLKALYKAQDWDTPGSQELAYLGIQGMAIEGTLEETCELEECVIDNNYVPYGITSFSDLDAAQAAREALDNRFVLLEQFRQLAYNILSQAEISNKASALSALTSEFISRLEQADTEEVDTPGVGESEGGGVGSNAAPEEIDTSERVFDLLFETGEVWLCEAGDTDALELEIVVIEPGPGNKRDNHYYGAEMLERYAHVFGGIKMYATDHVPEEKSVRTEVSEVLECPVRFTESGAPVARVGVFDPLFAKSVRNRASLGTLNSLHCSILASGTAQPGEIDGREYQVVESIDEAHSVDWVTQAGAGGHALNIIEKGEAKMGKVKKEKLETEDETEVEEAEPTAHPVTIKEKETDEVDTETEGGEPEVQTETQLPLAEIATRLGQTTMPAESVVKLVQLEYKDSDALEAAIAQELEALREAGSGRPVGMSGGAVDAGVSLEEVNKRKDSVLEKWGFIPKSREE